MCDSDQVNEGVARAYLVGIGQMIQGVAHNRSASGWQPVLRLFPHQRANLMALAKKAGNQPLAHIPRPARDKHAM